MRNILFATIVILTGLIPAHCQEVARHAAYVKGTAGWAGFVDESMLHHAVEGGSLRIYLTSRLSVEPELLYMHGPGLDRDVVLTPSVAFDFARSKRVRPYVIGGVGMLWHRDGFRTAPGQTTFFWGHQGTFSSGLGANIFVTGRLFVAPEFRIGWEPIFRSTISVGYRF